MFHNANANELISDFRLVLHDQKNILLALKRLEGRREGTGDGQIN
jgi:hypothetical protein